jgi:hypothetical protein
MLAMSLYADQPARRLRQVLGDVVVLMWVVAWVLVGRAVHDVVAGLAAPGRTLESAGTSLEAGLTSAGERVGDLPLVGDTLREPFASAGGAAASISDAGTAFQEGVGQAALLSALAVALWPVLLVLVLWLRTRLRFARRSAAARRLLRDGTDLDLFALRALARLPLPVLARVGEDPAGAWRRGDERVVRALAALDLEASGVALPPVGRTVHSG